MPEHPLRDTSVTHVDRVAFDPLASQHIRGGKLLGRYPSADHPDIGAQERAGFATYVYVSEPHTMDDCPFQTDQLVLAIRQAAVHATYVDDAFRVSAEEWVRIVRLAEAADG